MAQSHTVRSLDVVPIDDPIEHDVVEVRGDMRDHAKALELCRGADVVVHAAAALPIRGSRREILSVNIEGTATLLAAAREAGVRRFLYISSTSVYGSTRQLPTKEDSPPDPISPYGVAKLAAERYCISFSRVYESFESVVLRYFNVFGERQSPFSQYAAVVPRFVTAIAAGETIEIHGDGAQSRDFTYVGNVVDATVRAGGADGASGEIFNVAAGSPASVNTIADTIGEILGKPIERTHLPSRAGDIRDSWADLSKSQRVLGYAPEIALADGLRRTVEYLLR